MRLSRLPGAERLLHLFGNGSTDRNRQNGASGEAAASEGQSAATEGRASAGAALHEPWMPSTKALRGLTPTREGQPALHEAWTLLETIGAEERKEEIIDELVAVLRASWRRERDAPLPRGASQEEVMRFMREESVRVANATYRSAEASLLHEARQREAAGEAEVAAGEVRRVRDTLQEVLAEVKRAAEAYRQRAGDEQDAFEKAAEERLEALASRGQEIARRHEDAFDVAREHTQAFAETLQRLAERSERAAGVVRRRRSQGPYWTALGVGVAALVILGGLWLLRPGWALSEADRAHLELGRRVEAAVQSDAAITDREADALQNRTQALLPGRGKSSSGGDPPEEEGSEGEPSNGGDGAP